jgi:hypothetical protein
MVCIGHPFVIRLVCSIRPDLLIFDPDDPYSTSELIASRPGCDRGELRKASNH